MNNANPLMQTNNETRYFSGFYGNENLRQMLAELLEAKRLSHAYIIEGAHGTGKHTLAKLLAAAVNCENRFDKNSPVPCGTCSTCIKILSGNSVDVSYINRGENMTVGVDRIRSMCAASEMTSNENDVAVFIVEEAEKMTPAAQNALLTTLEEPTPNVLFLLLTEDCLSLLATIRSRAALLKLEWLTAGETEAVVLQNLKAASNVKKREPEKFAAAIKHSDGSPGRAMELLREKNDGVSELAEELVLTMLGTQGCKSTDLYARLPKKAAELEPVLTEAAIILRDLLAVKRVKEPRLGHYDTAAQAKSIAGNYSAALIAKKLEKILKALTDNAGNISVPLLHSELFI